MGDKYTDKFIQVAQSSAYLADIMRKGKQVVQFRQFMYTAVFNTLNAGTSQTAYVQTNVDSDFVITSMVYDGISDDGFSNLRLSQPFLFQVTDTSNSWPFYSEPTLLNLVAGGSGADTGGMDYFLPAPHVLGPNTRLKVDITNLAAQNVTRMNIGFKGSRIYYA